MFSPPNSKHEIGSSSNWLTGLLLHPFLPSASPSFLISFTNSSFSFPTTSFGFLPSFPPTPFSFLLPYFIILFPHFLFPHLVWTSFFFHSPTHVFLLPPFASFILFLTSSFILFLLSSFLYFSLSFLFHPILSISEHLLFFSTSSLLYTSLPPSFLPFLPLFIPIFPCLLVTPFLSLGSFPSFLLSSSRRVWSQLPSSRRFLKRSSWHQIKRLHKLFILSAEETCSVDFFFFVTFWTEKCVGWRRPAINELKTQIKEEAAPFLGCNWRCYVVRRQTRRENIFTQLK